MLLPSVDLMDAWKSGSEFDRVSRIVLTELLTRNGREFTDNNRCAARVEVVQAIERGRNRALTRSELEYAEDLAGGRIGLGSPTHRRLAATKRKGRSHLLRQWE